MVSIRNMSSVRGRGRRGGRVPAAGRLDGQLGGGSWIATRPPPSHMPRPPLCPAHPAPARPGRWRSGCRRARLHWRRQLPPPRPRSSHPQSGPQSTAAAGPAPACRTCLHGESMGRGRVGRDQLAGGPLGLLPPPARLQARRAPAAASSAGRPARLAPPIRIPRRSRSCPLLLADRQAGVRRCLLLLAGRPAGGQARGEQRAHPARGTSGCTAMRTTRAPDSCGNSLSWNCWPTVQGIRSPYGQRGAGSGGGRWVGRWSSPGGEGHGSAQGGGECAARAAAAGPPSNQRRGG